MLPRFRFVFRFCSESWISLFRFCHANLFCVPGLLRVILSFTGPISTGFPLLFLQTKHLCPRMVILHIFLTSRLTNQKCCRWLKSSVLLLVSFPPISPKYFPLIVPVPDPVGAGQKIDHVNVMDARRCGNKLDYFL